MWYRIKVGCQDMGAKPQRRDALVAQGPDLLDLMADVASQVTGAIEGLAGTDQPMLEGLMFLGAEVEVWASWNSFVEQDAGAEPFRRAMRESVIPAPSSGVGLPRTSTRTVRNGSSPK